MQLLARSDSRSGVIGAGCRDGRVGERGYRRAAQAGRPSLLAGEELRRAFAGVDAVVHLAWAIQRSAMNSSCSGVNVGGTNTVLDAVVNAEVPHLVYASSLGVYAPGG
ncbi:MAG: NAD-dependent epimerase/dehydratase family protein, partial [Actinomycetota bacterium]|nr:NAD-dependent epimerase/dehydratase family protein [Actinomycetota bacterium]